MFITFLFVTFFKLFCITLIHFTMQNDREHSLKHKLPHRKKQTNKLGGMWLITAGFGADNCQINAFSPLKLFKTQKDYRVHHQPIGHFNSKQEYNIIHVNLVMRVFLKITDLHPPCPRLLVTSAPSWLPVVWPFL